MSLDHMKSGEVIDLNNLGPQLGGKISVSLLRSEGLQLLRLVLTAGQVLADHYVEGEITVLCLEGHLLFEMEGEAQTMRPGMLIHLRGGVPHAVEAVEDSVLLLTVCHLTVEDEE